VVPLVPKPLTTIFVMCFKQGGSVEVAQVPEAVLKQELAQRQEPDWEPDATGDRHPFPGVCLVDPISRSDLPAPRR